MAPKPVLAPPAPITVIPGERFAKPEPGARASTKSEAAARPKPAPDNSAPNKGPPPVEAPERRPECEPRPTPHLGGDALHDMCADTFPPNRFPGNDVLVNGKRFDALQVGARVLWEIKTDRFDEFAPFLRDRVISKQGPELLRERDIARACGYDFVVGVSSAAHRVALEAQVADLKIVVTGC